MPDVCVKERLPACSGRYQPAAGRQIVVGQEGVRKGGGVGKVVVVVVGRWCWEGGGGGGGGGAAAAAGAAAEVDRMNE